jgi:hypothetical protein
MAVFTMLSSLSKAIMVKPIVVSVGFHLRHSA